MQPTRFETVTVQAIGSPTPTTLVKSAKVPLRLLVNNVGPVVIFIAGSVTDLTPLPSTATYRVFPGQQHSLVAAPGQGFYAVAAASSGLLSVTISEALPLSTA